MIKKIRLNLFDFFLIFLVLLAGLSVYFTFVKPIRFSRLIHREGASRYAEVEIVLPSDLTWIKSAVPAGEESRNVYGQLDWRILNFEDVNLGGEKLAKLKAKILVVKETSGLIRYGKYTLVKGNKIFLINDRVLIEGRIFDIKLLDERVLL